MPELTSLLKKDDYWKTDSHFKLSSGRHSTTYVNARLALFKDEYRQKFIDSALIQEIKALNPSFILSYTIGGILLAKEVQRVLAEQSVPLSLFIGRMQGKTIDWIRDLKDCDGHRILIVDDAITSGTRAKNAISQLEGIPGATVVGVLTAVDLSADDLKIHFRGQQIPVKRRLRITRETHAPTDCPMCRAGIPPIDLSNPEDDFISVILTQPFDRAESILSGYEAVYTLQKQKSLIDEIALWRPWLPIRAAGLPGARLEEDNRLIKFISALRNMAAFCQIDFAIISEIIGQLIRVPSVRIEARQIGCSFLVGDDNRLLEAFSATVRVTIPSSPRPDFQRLFPLFDAFNEMNYVFIASKEGRVRAMRPLSYPIAKGHCEGVDAIRAATKSNKSIGFIVKRGRRAISVYSRGRLEAIAEQSERTGLWEFSRPMQNVDEIIKFAKGVRAELLVTIIEIAREMVDRAYGGLFVVGDSRNLSLKEPKIEFEPFMLVELAIADIAELAKLDGAMMVSSEGELTAATVIIRNKIHQSDDSIKSDEFGGSRTEAARRTSIECPDCVCMCVSQNGRIEVYVAGRRWPISEPLTGLPG